MDYTSYFTDLINSKQYPFTFGVVIASDEVEVLLKSPVLLARLLNHFFNKNPQPFFSTFSCAVRTKVLTQPEVYWKQYPLALQKLLEFKLRDLDLTIYSKNDFLSRKAKNPNDFKWLECFLQRDLIKPSLYGVHIRSKG